MFREITINSFLNNERQQIFFFFMAVAQCERTWNSLLHIFDKSFVKVTFFQKKLLY